MWRLGSRMNKGRINHFCSAVKKAACLCPELRGSFIYINIFPPQSKVSWYPDSCSHWHLHFTCLASLFSWMFLLLAFRVSLCVCDTLQSVVRKLSIMRNAHFEGEDLLKKPDQVSLKEFLPPSSAQLSLVPASRIGEPRAWDDRFIALKGSRRSLARAQEGPGDPSGWFSCPGSFRMGPGH